MPARLQSHRTVEQRCQSSLQLRAFGMVNFNIAHWTITTQSNLLRVTGAGLPVMMTGPEVACSPGQSFTVTGFYPGGCNETYSLSGTFTSSNQFIATFTAAYGGQCFGCTTQVFSITATRQ